MGFGTGHHATTRMCLTALQTIDLTDRTVLDIGTGSGILAIAARRLDARMACGIDNDPDAIHAAQDNLALNPDVKNVWFDVADLSSFVASGFSRTDAGVRLKADATFDVGEFDVITANLTGPLLTRRADTLVTLAAPGGLIIVSGLLDAEREAVAAAFHRADLVWEAHEDEWVGMMFRTHVAPELKLGPTEGRM
jgi:ribosomal protein L11 methyltransferase